MTMQMLKLSLQTHRRKVSDARCDEPIGWNEGRSASNVSGIYVPWARSKDMEELSGRTQEMMESGAPHPVL